MENALLSKGSAITNEEILFACNKLYHEALIRGTTTTQESFCDSKKLRNIEIIGVGGKQNNPFNMLKS